MRGDALDGGKVDAGQEELVALHEAAFEEWGREAHDGFEKRGEG